MCTPLAAYFTCLLENTSIKDVAVVQDHCPGVPERIAKSCHTRKQRTSLSSSIPELSRWDSTPLSPDLVLRRKTRTPVNPLRVADFDEFHGCEPGFLADREQRDSSMPIFPDLRQALEQPDNRGSSIPQGTGRLQHPSNRRNSKDDYRLRLIAKKIRKNALPPKVPVRKSSIHGQDHDTWESEDDDDEEEESDNLLELETDSDSDEFASDTTPPLPLPHHHDMVFESATFDTIRHRYDYAQYERLPQHTQIPDTKLEPKHFRRCQQCSSIQDDLGMCVLNHELHGNFPIAGTSGTGKLKWGTDIALSDNAKSDLPVHTEKRTYQDGHDIVKRQGATAA